MKKGTLYVVATPIGNIDDISVRAKAVLSAVDAVAAEDTRHTGALLARLGIRARLVSCHEHNEDARIPELLALLAEGRDVALVSDAGTPLLSDPGFRLVRAAAAEGMRVSPVPGSSALLAALSIAGLPSDRFLFEGFLPASGGARRSRIEALAERGETLVLFESVHRVGATLTELAGALGPDRPAVAGRELTKLHETVYRGTLGDLQAQLDADPGAGKGEYTLVIGGAAESGHADAAETDRVLGVLLGYLGVRQAADAAAKILGVRKNEAYRRALVLREGSDDTY